MSIDNGIQLAKFKHSQKDMKLNKNRAWILLLLIIPDIALSAENGGRNQLFDSIHYTALSWICLMGGIGGLVHSIQYNAGIQLPHLVEKNLKMGVLGDILIGMVAGIVIFLLVPGDLPIGTDNVSFTSMINASGFALVGGYGGPLVLEKALGSTIAEMKETISSTQSRVQQHEQQSEKDQLALRLVDRQLSDTSQSVTPEEELMEAVKQASPLTQHQIRLQANEKRRLAWRRKSQDPHRTETGLTERTIPIFRALVDAAGISCNERRLSQLAYALKDQKIPDWKAALEYIDRAIKSLGEGRQIPHHYLYTWALAAIHEPESANALTEEGVALVKKRLSAALGFEPLRAGFKEELKGKTGEAVIPWLEKYGIELSELGIKL